jgi:hypothetical protein
MRHRHALRRFLVALLLSQALVVQGLLLAWSGALALTGADVGAICSAADAAESHGAGGGPGPAQPSHHDCLSACVAGHAAGAVVRVEFSRRAATSLQPARLSEATPPSLSGVHGFLARAPPVLI